MDYSLKDFDSRYQLKNPINIGCRIKILMAIQLLVASFCSQKKWAIVKSMCSMRSSRFSLPDIMNYQPLMNCSMRFRQSIKE